MDAALILCLLALIGYEGMILTYIFWGIYRATRVRPCCGECLRARDFVWSSSGLLAPSGPASAVGASQEVKAGIQVTGTSANSNSGRLWLAQEPGDGKAQSGQ